MGTGSCLSFSYTGCFGNRNNFATKEKCEATCMQPGVVGLDYPDPTQGSQQPQHQSYWSNTGSNMYDSTYQSQPGNDINDWGDMTVLNQIRDPILINAPSNPGSNSNSAGPNDDYVDEDLPMRYNLLATLNALSNTSPNFTARRPPDPLLDIPDCLEQSNTERGRNRRCAHNPTASHERYERLTRYALYPEIGYIPRVPILGATSI